ncbi:MAG: hypothetical protein PHX74_02070 [Candidatus Sumerlaeales bacterium]|mgnify:CR=1 FL=1|nr:hypothetical protein [Candidatus Sumerlaeales bacterium]
MKYLDSIFKISIIAIAILLCLNVLSTGKLTVATNVQGQNDSSYEVAPITGYTVGGLKEIIPLGDGKSFVVYTSDKFMVYQVRSK